MDGLYEILNFLTNDAVFTHQIPRIMGECRPWLWSQFPQLMKDSPRMNELLTDLDVAREPVVGDKEKLAVVIAAWVERVRQEFGLPEQIPVYELGADMHTHIDPLEEAKAMVGEERVIPVTPKGDL